MLYSLDEVKNALRIILRYKYFFIIAFFTLSFVQLSTNNVKEDNLAYFSLHYTKN